MTEASTPTRSRGLSRTALPIEGIAARVVDRFPDITFEIDLGELTLHVPPQRLVEVVAFCRDDQELDAKLLADLSGVHWPAGEHVVQLQASTTGWPEYRTSREVGVIEVLYILRSLGRNHWFRLSVATSDEEPRLPSITSLFPTANYHEREVFDFFGVEFTGHPDLTRILMPDDWIGHPHRKDYPLGGVEITYKNDKFIPPPQDRDLREVVD